MSTRKLEVLFMGDTTSFKKATDEAGQAAEGFGSKLQNIGKVAAVAFAAVGAAAIGAGVGLFKLGSNFDDAFDTIRVGTGATGEDLKALEGNFKNVFKSVPTDMGSAATAVADFNTRLGLTGPALEKASKTALELSRITKTDVAKNIENAAMVTQNWNLAAEDAVDVMDKLFVASQATGVPMDQLADGVQRFGPILREMGFSLDESIALLGTLEKAGLESEVVLKGLQKGFVEWAKAGKEPKKELQATIDLIKAATTPAEAAALAIEAFGVKAGPEMAEAIRTGKLSAEELTAALEDSAGAIKQTGLDTMDFGERWQLLKNRVLTALEPIATKIFELSDVALQKLTPAFEKVIEVGGRIGSALIPVVQAVGEKVAEFAKTELFPKIAEAVELVKELWPHIEELGKAIAEKLQPPLEAVGRFVAEHKEIWAAAGIVIGTVLVGAFLAWAGAAAAAAISTALALAPVIAIGVALTALVAAIIYVVKNWDELTERYPILERVSNELKAAWEKLTDFTMQKVVPAVQAVAKWFNDNVVPAMQAVAGFISGTLGPRLLDIAKWIFENVVPKVAALVEAWVKLHVKLAQEIIPPVVKLIGSVGEKVIDAAGVVGRWLGVIGGAFVTVKNTIEPPINTVIGLIQTLIDWIQKIPTPGDVLGKVGDLGGAVSSGVSKLDPRKWASGTRSAPPGWAIVGEEGPELVNLRGGERIYSAPETEAMLGGGGNTVTVNILGPVYARSPEEARMAAGDLGWMAAARSRGFSMGRAF